MSHKSSSRPARIEQDCWRIRLVPGPSGDDPETLEIQGRRRITEPFWPAFELPVEEIGRLLKTVSNAAMVADAYRAASCAPPPPSFPNSDTVALCQGPFYLLDLSESLGGHLVPTITMTLLTNDIPARPVLHLMDDELSRFLIDLKEIDQCLLPRLTTGSQNATITNNHHPGARFLD